MKDLGGRSAWLDAFLIHEPDEKWVWGDQTAWDWEHWASDEPNQGTGTCVKTTEQGWVRESCDETHYATCKADTKILVEPILPGTLIF